MELEDENEGASAPKLILRVLDDYTKEVRWTAEGAREGSDE
jgi:hypothetical protein